MAGNKTFTMIKPEAVAAGNMGKILDMIIASGFRVVALKYTRLSHSEAGTFYAVHKERPFYGELVDYMASGPIIRRSWKRTMPYCHSATSSAPPIQRRPLKAPFASAPR